MLLASTLGHLAELFNYAGVVTLRLQRIYWLL
jgi:hypothetical protein